MVSMLAIIILEELVLAIIILEELVLAIIILEELVLITSEDLPFLIYFLFTVSFRLQ